MKEFKSAFRPSIMEYLEFRSAMGYSNEHEQQLQHFDRYCYEHCPEQTELTKEVSVAGSTTKSQEAVPV